MAVSIVAGLVAAVIAARLGGGAYGRDRARTATDSPASGRSADQLRPASTGTAAPPTTSPRTTTSIARPVPPVLAATEVRRYLDSRSGDITAAVLDLRTGTTSSWRPGIAEDTASIVKVDILATLLHDDQRDGRSLSAADRDLATTMIEQSDDDAATDLWDEIGGSSGLAAFNTLVPLEHTTPGTGPYWGLTEVTATDEVRLLRAIVRSSPVLTSGSRRYELSLMEHVEASEAWGVSAGVPAGATVALKNGWLPLEGDTDWQINSIGWIHGDGRDYILAVLTSGNPDEEYGIDTIEGLSRMVWAALGRT